LPGAHISPGGFALVAMAATFGASVRATFTAIVFLFELTRDYQIILPLMLASVLAEIVATALLPDSLMTEKLSRRGLRVQSDFEVDILRSVVVQDVMTADVETFSPTTPIGEARHRLEAGQHGAYPLVDDRGNCVGIVARHDFLQARGHDRLPLSTIATGDVVTAAPGDTLLVALRLMLEEDVGHLPVVSGHKLVGMCTRTDVLRAR